MNTYRIVHRNDPLAEDENVPPEAHAIVIRSCGSPGCYHAHVLLVDEEGNPMVQATFTEDMAMRVLEICRRLKHS